MRACEVDELNKTRLWLCLVEFVTSRVDVEVTTCFLLSSFSLYVHAVQWLERF